MRVLVFGSRNLTARHLPVMRRFILAEVLYCFENDMGPVPLEWIDDRLAHRVPDDAEFRSGFLWLVHGDGPPGKVPGAIGADKLAEVAASLEWPDTRRVRRFPPAPVGDESWGTAAARRNAEMVALKPDKALCVHENLDASRGSIITADCLKRAGIPFRYVRVSSSGAVLSVEER